MKLVTILIAAAMTIPVLAGGNANCSMEAHEKGKAKHACSAECDHGTNHEGEEVELTGKLLCRHCNLHETDRCEKVFVTEAGERYPICPHSNLTELTSLSEHGSARLVVKGVLMHTDTDSPVLMAESGRSAE